MITRRSIWKIFEGIRFLVLVLAVLPMAVQAGALPEFLYRQVNVQFTQKNGQPVAGASIYGFCRELNLLWPRRDHEIEGRNDVLWDESFLGKTDTNGLFTATVPPGQWGFFALGHSSTAPETVVAGWSDFSERAAGSTIHLAPAMTKQWTLSFTNAALTPKRIFIQPENFPAWIPVNVGTAALHLEIPAGRFQLWAEGDATAEHPGFALGWEILSSRTADGNIIAPGKGALIECKGGKGKAVLSWARARTFGLEGTLNVCDDAKVWLTPGLFTLGYNRPVGSRLMGDFLGQLYTLREGTSAAFDMQTPLTEGLVEGISQPNKKGRCDISAQLFLVDGNGHIVNELYDAERKPVNLKAKVTLNGEEIEARPASRAVASEEGEEEEETGTSTNREAHLLFTANIGTAHSMAGAKWEFKAPPGVLSQLDVIPSQGINLATATFRMEVPQVIQQDAQNLLVQAETMAAAMDKISGRRRRVEPTEISINPAHRGAVSAHDGSRITIGTRLFFSDEPMAAHTIVHELGHNFGFKHGGLHETVVETTRCFGMDQITEQPAKWMFMDRMNGIARDETPFPKYHNVGLYLYCYAQGGLRFLQYMSANEYTVTAKLEKRGYTADEVTAAMLNIALGRDMTRICGNYGLNITTERVKAAMVAVRGL